MYVWRGINLIMTAFFLLAACANLNDADAYLWVPIYLSPVIFSAPLILKPALSDTRAWKGGSVVLFTLCCTMALYQVVRLMEAIQNKLQNPLQHEEGREMGGILIIITWLGVSRFTSIARPNSSVSNKGLMSALLLMTITLTFMPLFIWSLCFISDWHTRLGHCSGMFKS